MRGQRPVGRRRPGVLARRARLGLALAAGLLAFVAGYQVHRHWTGWWSSGGAAGPEDGGAVSAGPPGAPDRSVPSELLAFLPVGLDDYARSAVDTAPIADARRDPIVHEQNGYEVEYSFDRALTGRLLRLLRRSRVEHGHVIALDARTGRVLAYVSTDLDAFPPQSSYPAASLVKIVTAAAALRVAPEEARRPCLYNGNRYRLTPSRVHRPTRGNEASLERALATSNNQCFAQLAVETVGSASLVETLEEFGWRAAPAPGHAVGQVDPGEGDYDLGRLGCGLSGCQITPLHAAQLAATLADGMQVTPWWIDRVRDPSGAPLELPATAPPRRVMSQDIAAELRSMLVRTTTNGTARRAFRDRRGRPKLGSVRVAGKTGNLSGKQPAGRYEWFVGVAPAERPTIAVAVLQLQGQLWWSRSSEVAADLLVEIFCDRGRCDPTLADRFTEGPDDSSTPVLLSGARDDQIVPASPGS